MIQTNLGMKKLQGGDYVDAAFYNEDSAFNGNVDRVEAHMTDTTVHVTEEEKEAWTHAKVESLSADKVTAGILAGKVKAHPTAMAGSEAQLRDVVLVTVDPGAGAAAGYPDGTVILVYE
jgi:hypothetical protein